MRGKAERLFSLEKEQQPRGDLVNVHKYLMGGSKQNEGRLFSEILRVRGKGLKVEHEKFCLIIKKFLM